MKVKFIAVLLAISFSSTAFAVGIPAPKETKVKKERPRAKWRGYLGIGSTIRPKTDYTLKYQGQSVASHSDSDENSTLISGEIEALVSSFFSTSAVLESSSYKYKDGSLNDSELSLLVMPKFRLYGGLWVGFGAGMLRTSFGQIGLTSGTVTIMLDQPSVATFLISPRIGYDFEVNPGFSLGIFASYFRSSGSVKVSYTDTSVPLSAQFDEDFTRKWFALNLRAGFDF